MNAGQYPWFKREDVDGFFALFQNNLANFALISATLLGMGFPVSIVFGRIIPGAAVAVLFGNIYYAFMAKRLAEKEGRSDVTALSYGISTPVMFIYLFGVLGVALSATGDHTLAWQIGVAACFIGGVIEMLGSIVGPWIRANLPRAAMLGALAGVAFAFIGGELFFTTFEMPILGPLVLGLILIGLIAKVVMPFKIPASLFAIVIGTVLAYVLGQQEMGAIREGMDHLGFYPLLPTFAAFAGMREMFVTTTGIFAAVLPIQIYNLIETMNNVEAMAAAGDEYSVREAQLVDGGGTVLGALFGGVFPTTVYIASVGSKHMRAGRGYSVLNGIVFVVATLFGIIGAISAIIPTAVIAPILVFVGVSMVAQAFMSSPHRHAPAVVVAMFPYFCNFLMTRFMRHMPEVFAEQWPAIEPLGQGAMFTALIWGSFTVFIIERDWMKASFISLIGYIGAALGFMHAPEVSWNLFGDYALGYLLLAAAMYAFHHYYQSIGKELSPEDSLKIE